MEDFIYIIKETANFDKVYIDRERYIGASTDYNTAREKFDRARRFHTVTNSSIDFFEYIDNNAQPIWGSNILPSARATIRVTLIAVPTFS